MNLEIFVREGSGLHLLQDYRNEWRHRQEDAWDVIRERVLRSPYPSLVERYALKGERGARMVASIMLDIPNTAIKVECWIRALNQAAKEDDEIRYKRLINKFQHLVAPYAGTQQTFEGNKFDAKLVEWPK